MFGQGIKAVGVFDEVGEDKMPLELSTALSVCHGMV